MDWKTSVEMLSCGPVCGAVPLSARLGKKSQEIGAHAVVLVDVRLRTPHLGCAQERKEALSEADGGYSSNARHPGEASAVCTRQYG